MGKTIATKRITLYKMLEGSTLTDALTEERRETDDDFTVTSLKLEQQPACLVYGAISTRTKWSTDIKNLTGQVVDLWNSSPGAVLLIQDSSNAIWALTWGTGFHFLDSEKIDFGFGSRVVARSALPSEVKSLTKTVLDHRARVDRSSMPNGSTIRDLGVDGYGEVVSRIEAKAKIKNLSVGDKVIQLRAADSLNLPLAKSSQELLLDLEALEELSGEPVLPGLESLEQLTALKPRDSRVSALDQKLVEAIKSTKTNRLGISWPHDRLEVYGTVMSAKVNGLGDRKRRVFEQAPEINEVRDWFADIPKEQLIDRLKTVKIELHSEADPQAHSLVSVPVPLRRWLAFEVEEDGQRFCLHDGNWYKMDDRYLSRIDERVHEILSQPASLTMPPWGDEQEDVYNKFAARHLSGYCLDRKLISTPIHSRGGIEPCDVFVAPGTLIHVKRGRSSADLSHLLAQGLVSTDALARDENARKAWTERIVKESKGEVTDAELKEVILAIGSERPITVDSLFTFTKVNLVKQFDALRYLDVKVRVTTINSPT